MLPTRHLDICVRGIHKEENYCMQSSARWKECRREEQTSPRLVLALEIPAGLHEPAQASQSRSVPKPRTTIPQGYGNTLHLTRLMAKFGIQIHHHWNCYTTYKQEWLVPFHEGHCLFPDLNHHPLPIRWAVFLKALQLYPSPVPGVTPHPLKWMTRNAHTISAEVSAQICTVNLTLHRIHRSMPPFQFLVFPLLNFSSSAFASWWASHFQHHHLIEKIAPVIPPH